jgi:hypothetical protein
MGHTRPKRSEGLSGRYWVVSGLATWIPLEALRSLTGATR